MGEVEAVKVLPGLYIGGSRAARSHHKDTYALVVNCTPCVKRTVPENKFVRINLKERQVKNKTISQRELQQLCEEVQQVASRIHRTLAVAGTVLVHCSAGVYRSATMVCSYLMLHQHLSVSESMVFLKEKSKRTSPNSMVAVLKGVERLIASGK